MAQPTLVATPEPEVAADAGDRTSWLSFFDPLLRLRSVVTPFPRAGLFYVRSWGNWLKHRGDDGVPAVRPTLMMTGHALADEAVIAGFRVLKAPAPPSSLVRAEREAAAAIQLAETNGWLADPASYHPEPPPLERPTAHWRTSRKVRYWRVSFEGEYEPFPGEPGRERWLSYTANRRTRAWVLQHPEPRPWLVCVHGTSMGTPSRDLSLFRARWLHHDLGLNLVFPVLPLHGPRGEDLPPHTAFPGEDVMDNIHGIAQSVWDTRRLARWAAAQDGGQPVGITGISLGGFVAAIVAGLEDNLACAILGVPAVDLLDLIDHHSNRSGDPQYEAVLELARKLGKIVSPLSFTPRLPYDRRFIYAGLADRLAHPRHQVGRLWEHWGRPEVLWYKGGHVAFSRNKDVGRFMRGALESSGLVGTTP